MTWKCFSYLFASVRIPYHDLLVQRKFSIAREKQELKATLGSVCIPNCFCMPMRVFYHLGTKQRIKPNSCDLCEIKLFWKTSIVLSFFLKGIKTSRFLYLRMYTWAFRYRDPIVSQLYHQNHLLDVFFKQKSFVNWNKTENSGKKVKEAWVIKAFNLIMMYILIFLFWGYILS